VPRAVIRIRKDPAYRREAFESGLRRLGYDITDGTRDNRDYFPDGSNDLLVLWNKKAGVDEKMADAWEAKGGTVLVVENAYLQKVDKSAYAISVHGHNGSGWFPVGNEDRFTPLGFELKPARFDHQMPALVVGQRGVGSKLMASPPRWAEDRAAKLDRAGVHTLLRPHPGQLKPRIPLAVDLARAGSVHIWSSSVGVHALIEGLQVKHHAPHWICQEAQLVGRELALSEMAHGQWTGAEIAAGEPFERMRVCDWGYGWR
jgi:hypothetical protein